MTEKRYRIEKSHSGHIVDYGTEWLPHLLENLNVICDRLNEQHETIQQLKAEIKQLNHDLDLCEENNTNEVLNALRIELTSRMNDCIEEFKQ